MKQLIEKALQVNKETKQIDFKRSFDRSSERDFLEFVKDIVAMANSDGGIIIYGLEDNGEPSKADVNPISTLDPAKITDKIFKYTRNQFSDFDIKCLSKNSYPVVAIIISKIDIPMVFIKPGLYKVTEKNKQDRVFSQGTIYFRHGPKSEPFVPEDLQHVIDRRLRSIRKEWMAGVKKVVEAPIDSQVLVISKEVRQSNSENATPFRIVDDPNVAALRLTDPNQLYPYRQNDILAEFRNQFPLPVKISPFDIIAIRKAYNISEQEKYFYRPIHGSPQYSREFLNWVISSFSKDNDFFSKAKKMIRSSG